MGQDEAFSLGPDSESTITLTVIQKQLDEKGE